MNEAEMLVLIRNRFPDPQYAVMPHVSDGTGGYGTRTADAIVMSVWPSRGLELMGMETKVSRSDWIRELKNPAKAEGIAKYMDRWWVVVSERKIVGPGELPPTWGLLVAHGTTLRVDVEAPKLGPMPINRSFLAAILRNASRNVVPKDGIADLLTREREAGYKAGHRDGALSQGFRGDELAETKARIRAFEEASGVQIDSPWNSGDIGRAVRWLLDFDGLEGIRSALRTAVHASEQLNAVVLKADEKLPPAFRRRL